MYYALFKLYYKVISLFLCVVLFGCSATSYDKAEIQEVLNPNGQFYFLTPNSKRLSPDVGKLFGFYCENGKQIRELSTKFQAILPESPSGLPLGIAAEIQRDSLKKIRSTLKNYYNIDENSRGYFRRNTPRWGEPQAVSLFNFNSRKYPNKLPPIVGLESRSLEAYQSHFRRLPFDGDIQTSISSYMERSVPTIIEISENLPLLIGMNPLPYFTPTSSKHSKTTSLSQGDKWIYGTIGFPAKETLEVTGSTREKIFPIVRGRPLEPATFSAFYTMLIPLELQKKLWPHLVVRGGKWLWMDYFFLKEDGSYNFQRAIVDRKSIFEEYIKTFTKVKEAQTSDPQVLNFEVSLDLSVLCQYSRPISDLVSH